MLKTRLGTIFSDLTWGKKSFGEIQARQKELELHVLEKFPLAPISQRSFFVLAALPIAGRLS
jgi:hypothetical protein